MDLLYQGSLTKPGLPPTLVHRPNGLLNPQRLLNLLPGSNAFFFFYFLAKGRGYLFVTLQNSSPKQIVRSFAAQIIFL